ASSKCSRKCSSVKCESTPSRTRTRVTRAPPETLAISRIRSRISACSCTAPPPPAPRPPPRRPPPPRAAIAPRRRPSFRPRPRSRRPPRAAGRAPGRARPPPGRRGGGSSGGTALPAAPTRPRRAGAGCRAAPRTTRRRRARRRRRRRRRRAAQPARLPARAPRRRPAPRRARAPPPRGRQRRPGASGCRRRSPSRSLHLELQEVRRARDARVVVADRLLAEQGEPVVRHLQRALDDAPQVLLDRPLVLRRRRDDLRLEDRAVAVDRVAVPQDPARRLRAAVADARARLHLHRGSVRLLVRVDQAERLVA